MHKFARILTKLLVLVVLTWFSLVNHAAAMPSFMHSSTHCATLCTSIVFNKEGSEQSLLEEKDDEPTTPFYAQAQLSYFYAAHAKNYSSGLALRPPPKVPLYILHQAFRI